MFLLSENICINTFLGLKQLSGAAEIIIIESLLALFER